MMDNGKIVGIHKTNIDYTKNTMREICSEVECKLDETIEINLDRNNSLIIFKIKALFSLDNIMFIDA